MNDPLNTAHLKEQLHALLKQHRALDDKIKEIELEPRPNEIEMRRLKKQKLFIKDEISRIEDSLYPDIIA
jgi:hypothetical protein